jgi:5-aminopentanamidase
MPKIYLAQMEPVLFEKESNLNKMKVFIEKASTEEADLILFPELCLTGYFTRDKTIELAEDLNGPSVKKIKIWAKEYNIKIIFGFVENLDGKIYNSACFINNDGNIIGTYQKIHLWDEEYKYFSPGQECKVWATDIGKIGIMICYDTEMPETSRLLALAGAEMIMTPTANMSPFEHFQSLLIQCRAAENQVFVATTNRTGTEESTCFFGESAAADPFGRHIVKADQTESGYTITCDLALIEKCRNSVDYIRDRKPQLYKDLIKA